MCTNLVHVTPELWELFGMPGVSLGTFWYAADPVTHAEITGSAGSFWRTRANIAEALRRQIVVRAGIVKVITGRTPPPPGRNYGRLASPRSALTTPAASAGRPTTRRQLGRSCAAGAGMAAQRSPLTVMCPRVCSADSWSPGMSRQRRSPAS